MSVAPQLGTKSGHDWLIVGSISPLSSTHESTLKLGTVTQNWIEVSRALLRKFHEDLGHILRHARVTGSEAASVLFGKARPFTSRSLAAARQQARPHGSRVRRESHARFCERPVVQFHRPTHPGGGRDYRKSRKGDWQQPSLKLNTAEPGTVACTCTLILARRTRSVCREVANGSLSRQGERVRSSDNSYKIAAGQPSIPETRGNVLGTRAARRTRVRSAFKNDRENEPNMTTYPLEFHRRSEQKWAHRAQGSSARESTPRAVRVASSQRGQHRPGQSELRDILARRPWLPAIGRWLWAEYYAVEQPLPERLAALLKELKGRRH